MTENDKRSNQETALQQLTQDAVMKMSRGVGDMPCVGLVVDAGCAKAIRRPGGSSILPAGIKEVSGEFEAGHTVSVRDENGNELARGLSHYSSRELEMIKGHKSSEIVSILGEKTYDEVIHRDDLVIL